MNQVSSVIHLFKQYVRGTKEKAPVVEKTILLCFLTNAVQKGIKTESRKVHTTTKIIKHLYDRKPAEEFEFILHHVVEIIKYPDEIYENLSGKTGNYCFVKQVGNDRYFASIETTDSIDDSGEAMSFLVTVFRLRDSAYLEKYKLLWSWKGGTPSS